MSPLKNEIEQELWARVYATEYERLSHARHSSLDVRPSAETILALRGGATLGADSAVQALRSANCDSHRYKYEPGGRRCSKCNVFEVKLG